MLHIIPKIVRYSLLINQQILKVFNPLGDGLRHLILKIVTMSLIRKARTRFTYEHFFVAGCLYTADVLRPHKRWICFGSPLGDALRQVGLAPPFSFLIQSILISIPKILRYSLKIGSALYKYMRIYL
jgi:hypothetical protein